MSGEIEEAREGDPQRARRLVDLKVDEVSVVDSPAIQREFLIVKRLEDESMGVFDSSDTKEVTEVTKAEIEATEAAITKAFSEQGWDFADVSKIADAKKPLPEDLKTGLRTVLPLMRTMAGKASPEEKAAIMRIIAFLGQVEGGRLPMPNGFPKASAKAAKAEEEDEKKAAKAGEKDEETKREERKQKALSLDDTNAAAFIQVDEDGQLHFVTKGGKAFTGRRTQALTEASTKLLAMLKEVDEEAFKRTVSELIGKELPKDPVVGSEVRPAPVKKSEGADDAPAWAADIVKKLSAQNDRLAAIEKARSPSTSVDAAGGTDDATKVEKSFWHGVL